MQRLWKIFLHKYILSWNINYATLMYFWWSSSNQSTLLRRIFLNYIFLTLFLTKYLMQHLNHLHKLHSKWQKDIFKLVLVTHYLAVCYLNLILCIKMKKQLTYWWWNFWDAAKYAISYSYAQILRDLQWSKLNITSY